MHLNRAPFRIEYVDANGYPQWTAHIGTYREAHVMAYELQLTGATGVVIFQDAAVPTHPCASASKYPGAPRTIPVR